MIKNKPILISIVCFLFLTQFVLSQGQPGQDGENIVKIEEKQEINDSQNLRKDPIQVSNEKDDKDVDIDKDDDDDKDDKDDNNEECQTFEDCPMLHNCISNKCIHKDLFPLTFQEIIGIILILALVGFAQAGGIGGGPILMPILIGIMNYDAKQAIALSFVLIFGGSCGNFLNNSGHQTKHQTPLIFYDLVIISLPYLLAGAIIGVAVNHFLPTSIIVIILVYVLYNSAQKTSKKYKEMVQNERQQQQEQNIPLIDVQADAGKTPYKKKDTISQELQDIYEKERIQYPKEKFLKMGAVLVVIIGLSLLKGGKGVDSLLGIPPCGIYYWIVNLIIIVVCLVMSKRFSLEMLNFEEEKVQNNYDFDKFGEKFDELKVQNTSKAAVIAGVIGGLLGLGGGVILTPKWLEMGIPSDRTAATATFTVCFTSFISFFTTFLAGRYNFIEVVFFWVLSFIASFIVSRLLKYAVDKYKKKSILIGVLLCVIVLALVLLPIISVINMISDPEQIYKFGKLC